MEKNQCRSDKTVILNTLTEQCLQKFTLLSSEMLLQQSPITEATSYIPIVLCLQSPCCAKEYTCRICHNDKEDHEIDRHSVVEIRCLKCNTRQKVRLSRNMQGSPFPTARPPGASKTTSLASGFEQIFLLYLIYTVCRSTNFKILGVGQVMILRKGEPWYGASINHDPMQIVPWLKSIVNNTRFCISTSSKREC